MMLKLFKQKLQITRFIRVLIWAIVFTSLLLGATAAHSQEEIQKIELDGSQYEVAYVGRTYDSESNQTTFTYTVQVNDDPALSHFTVEFPPSDPSLALVASSPEEATSVGLDPTTGIDGMKWGGPLQAGQSRTYSFTLPGNIAEGPVDVAVKAGEFAAIGERPGPALGEGPSSDNTSIEATTESSETTTEDTTPATEATTQDTVSSTEPATESADTSATAQATESQALPESGAILPNSSSAIALVLAGLVLVSLVGAGAATAVANRE